MQIGNAMFNAGSVAAQVFSDFMEATPLATITTNAIAGSGTNFAATTAAIVATSPGGHGVIRAVTGTTSGDGYRYNQSSKSFALSPTLGYLEMGFRISSPDWTNAQATFGFSTSAVSASLKNANDYCVLDINASTAKLIYRADGATAVEVTLPTFTRTADKWFDFYAIIRGVNVGSSSKIEFDVKSDAAGWDLRGETALISTKPLPGNSDVMHFGGQVMTGAAAASTLDVDYSGAIQYRVA